MNLKKRSLIIIIAIAVLLIVGAGVIKFVIFPGKSAPPSAAALQSWQFAVDKITTNLQGSNMIQVQLTLQAPNGNVLGELSSRAAQVDDAVISVLHQLSAADLSQPTGVSILKKLVIGRIDSILTTGKISAVYINSLIVQ